VGNSAAALAELRAVVATGDCTAEDRLALVELYASENGGQARAVEELRAVLADRPDHLPAIRQMVALYPASEPAGRIRLLRSARILGYAEQKELGELGRLEAQVPPFLGVLTDDLRAHHLAVEEVRGPLGQIWQAIHEHLERLYPLQTSATELRAFDPVQDGVDPRAIAQRLGFSPDGFEVIVAQKSPHPAWIALEQVPKIVLHAPLLSGSAAETTFLLARSIEYLRSNFSLLARIGPRERRELGLLLKAMAKPADQREPSANEFMGLLSRQQIKAAERVVNAAGDVIPDLDVLAWMRGVDNLMSQVGLLICDDLQAAARMSARLGGLESSVLSDGRIVMRSLPGGQNLLRFYLSAHYYELYAAMSAARSGVPGQV
jgi:hypothetical protein